MPDAAIIIRRRRLQVIDARVEKGNEPSHTGVYVSVKGGV